MTHTILILSDQNSLSMDDTLAVTAIERGVLFGEQLVDVVRLESHEEKLVSKSEIRNRPTRGDDLLVAKRLAAHVERSRE